MAGRDSWGRDRTRNTEAWARICAGEGFIYVADLPDYDRIKIGFSLTPERRVSTLRLGRTPAKLLAKMRGSIRDEKALHRALKAIDRSFPWPPSECYPRSILNHPAIPAELREACA